MVGMIISAVISAAIWTAGASAQTCETHTGLPVPRYVSLKFSNVNGRIGPSEGHEIRWNYIQAGLPVEIIAETADWRRVRDPDGEETWMHRRTLIGTRTVITLDEVTLMARAEEGATPNARAEPGAILTLENCRNGWCQVSSGRLEGWVPGETLWGLYEDEQSGMSDLIDTASLCIVSSESTTP